MANSDPSEIPKGLVSLLMFSAKRFRQGSGLVAMIDLRGRWMRTDIKPTEEDWPRLSVSEFARKFDLDQPGFGTCSWSRSSGQKIIVGITINPGEGIILHDWRLHGWQADSKLAAYRVRVVFTVPHFGGRRPWWICPGCGQRVQHLYRKPMFQCRTCHGLTYPVRREHVADAVTRGTRKRLQRIARRFGLTPGDEFPAEKPPRMHWRTFSRLKREYEELTRLEQMAQYIGLVMCEGPWPELPAVLDNLRAMWQIVKRPPPGEDLPRSARRRLSRPPAPRRPLAIPLATLVRRAGVPPEFARDAVRRRLLRPDVGRGGDMGRYRPRLVGWLKKLHALRAAGMSWAEIRAWTRRRWQPGHEHERVWPDGIPR